MKKPLPVLVSIGETENLNGCDIETIKSALDFFSWIDSFTLGKFKFKRSRRKPVYICENSSLVPEKSFFSGYIFEERKPGEFSFWRLDNIKNGPKSNGFKTEPITDREAWKVLQALERSVYNGSGKGFLLIQHKN